MWLIERDRAQFCTAIQIKQNGVIGENGNISSIMGFVFSGRHFDTLYVHLFYAWQEHLLYFNISVRILALAS